MEITKRKTAIHRSLETTTKRPGGEKISTIQEKDSHSFGQRAQDTAQWDSNDTHLKFNQDLHTKVETHIDPAVECGSGCNYGAHLLAIQHIKIFGHAVPITFPESCSTELFSQLQIKQGWSINNRYVGRSIRKIFETDGQQQIFHGIVPRFLRAKRKGYQKGPTLFHILYDDGDEEDMCLQELFNCMDIHVNFYFH